jgi:hypothetical protein
VTDEYKLNAQAARGEQAKSLYEHPFIKDAFAAVEDQILSAWKESRADEKEQRDNAYLMLRLLQNFRQQFVAAIASGEASQKELLRIRDQSKLRRIING